MVTAMPTRFALWLLAAATLYGSSLKVPKNEAGFQTSDRCIACHNGLQTASGRDVSIGFAWRSSIMANSSRDPYWQASLRRETIDHPTAQLQIQDECSACHMPIIRYEAKIHGELGEVFSHLPFDTKKKSGQEAVDGVTCSVCHQITTEKFGTKAGMSGNFVINAPQTDNIHPEYGPFDIVAGNQEIMYSSTGGLQPNNGQHIRDARLCAECHQLYTTAHGPGGKIIGQLPEQMPYLEWLNSDYYRKQQTCQDCHMTPVNEPAPIARVLGITRNGVREHVFVGDNFFMQDMLNRYRDELSVAALSNELTVAAQGTRQFLQTRSARVMIQGAKVANGLLEADVRVENLTGHKLPSAFPSRRAWLHFSVKDRNGNRVFDSGALNPDGSIVGNDNDANPHEYEPHYSEITSSDQVEIYEDILGDSSGVVTTGLISAVRYLKDNRLLPDGFNKAGVPHDIAVVGKAYEDPKFTNGADTVRYSVPTGNAAGPFTIAVELWYQPIGYRWAHNLKPYASAAEPNRFLRFYDSMPDSSAIVLASAQATR